LGTIVVVIAMGYKFNKQTSLTSFSIYLFLCFQKPNLPTSIYRAMVVVLALDGPNVWMHACDRKAHLFEKIMPMTFEFFFIVQHIDKLQYASKHGGR
jgi:hypothetical protein